MAMPRRKHAGDTVVIASPPLVRRDATGAAVPTPAPAGAESPPPPPMQSATLGAAWLVRSLAVLLLFGALMLVLRTSLSIVSVDDDRGVARLPDTAPAAPARRCAVDGYGVCSHKFGVNGSQPGDDHGAGALIQAFSTLLRSGVGCFDVDLFASADDVVFVGHPRDEATRLGLLQQGGVELLTSEQLQAARCMLFADLAALVLAVPEVEVEMLTLEPKGRLKDSLQLLSAVALTITAHPVLVKRMAVITPLLTVAASLRSSYPQLQLAAAMLDAAPQDTAGEHGLCDGATSIETRVQRLGLYNIIMPSILASDLPGCRQIMPYIGQSGKAARPASMVMAWMVDAPSAVDDTRRHYGSTVTHVITNAPATIAPHCFSENVL